MVEIGVRGPDKLPLPQTCIRSSNKSFNLFGPIFCLFLFNLSRMGNVTALPKSQAGTILSLFLAPTWHLITEEEWNSLISTCKPTDSPWCPHPAGVQLPPGVPHLPLWVWKTASTLSPPYPFMALEKQTPSSDLETVGKIGLGKEQWLSCRTKAVRNVAGLRSGCRPPQQAGPRK